jgi:hypothetical protein
VTRTSPRRSSTAGSTKDGRRGRSEPWDGRLEGRHEGGSGCPELALILPGTTDAGNKVSLAGAVNPSKPVSTDQRGDHDGAVKTPSKGLETRRTGGAKAHGTPIEAKPVSLREGLRRGIVHVEDLRLLGPARPLGWARRRRTR